jgi:hypothetical protein
VTNRATRVIMSDGLPDVVAVSLRGVQLAWEDVAALRPEIGVEVVHEDIEAPRPVEAVSVMEPRPPISQNAPAKTPRPGSADAWIDELFPNGAWRLRKPPRIHRAIEQKIEDRNAELVRKAKSCNEKATLLEHVSLTAVRDALKNRR